MSTLKSVVLIHGAWANGSAWSGVIERLQREGYHVTAPQLPMSSLGDDAPNVLGLVYESAFAPDEGETMKGLIDGGPQPPGAAAIRPDSRGYLWLAPDGFQRFFATDVEPVQAQVMSAVQQPIANSEFMGSEAFARPLWRSLPSWYLVTEDDQMIRPATQHFFAKRMGATVASIAGSHASMISHPDEVTAFILKAAHTVAAGTDAAVAAP